MTKSKDMSMGEIALATYKAKPLMMGQIKNISKKGLAFRYIDNGKEAAELSELDIIFAQDTFYLKNVPFKSVADFNEVSESQFSSIAMRQRCVQFKEMMPIQTFLLYYFIQNYTRDKT